MRRTILSLVVVSALSVLVAIPALGATPPTVPFDSTADLIVLENGCDCIVEIAEDGTIEVIATAADVAAADPDAIDEFDVDFNESGLAFAASGTGYFVNSGTNSIMTLGPDGALGLLISGTDVATALGSTGIDVEKFAFGADGVLWATEDSVGNILNIDVATGAITVVATEADFEALPDVSTADFTGGIAVDASGQVYIGSDGTPDGVLGIAPDGALSLVASEPDEIQSLILNGTGGTFTLDFAGEVTDPIAVGAAASVVQAALEALPSVDAGDILVAGEGTPSDGYRLLFSGAYAATNVPTVLISTTGFTGSTDVNNDVVGGRFQDMDLHATLDGDGVLVIGDDSPATVYRVRADGSSTALIVETQFEAVTGGGNDPEGGLAYDENGVLYISEEDTGNILSWDGSTLAIAHSESAIQSATADESPELDGGIAFRMPIVDVTPVITAPTDAVAGEAITYTIAVTNNGDDTLDGLTLDTGAGLEDVAVSVDSGSLVGMLWTGELAPGATAIVTVNATVPSGATGTLDLAATVAAALGAVDTDTSNDSDTASVAVSTPADPSVSPPADPSVSPSADLSVTADAPVSLPVGESGDITLTVTNSGPDAATDVVVVDTLPAGTVLEVASSDELTCTEADGVVTCTLDVLAAGASATITLQITTDVLDCTQAGQEEDVECAFEGVVLDELVNAASVTSATADPDASNDDARSTIVLDTSDVDVDLPAAGATTDQLALFALGSLLLGLVLVVRTSPLTPRRVVAG